MQKHLAKSILSAKQRKSLPAGDFVFPRQRRFPIHDLYHGRLALIYVLSPAHAASRDAVVETVLARYPQLQSFWREKSRALSTRSTSMRIIENPYGIDLPRGKKSGRIGMGEATHIIVSSANGPHALCRSEAAVDAVYPSKAGKITCYRCIKLNAMNAKKGLVKRYMRPGDRAKRLLHVQIEGGREGEFIGRRTPRVAQRALIYPGGGRQTAFGPHAIGSFDWGGLPVQRGQGPTQTRFSDRSDVVKKIPLDPKTAKQFLEAVSTRYAGQYARVANPAKGIRVARGSESVRMTDLGSGAVRRYQVQFKDIVMTFPRRADAEAATATIEQAVQFGSKTMMNAALRAARQMAAKYNPAASRRRASAGSGAQGGFDRGDVTAHPAYFAGYDAARSAYEAGGVSRRSRRGSFEDSGVTMISFDEFAKRAAHHGKAPRSGEGAKAFKAGVEAVYYSVKPYVEQAYGDVPSPRLNGMKAVKARIFAIILAMGLNPDRLSTRDMHAVAEQAHVTVQDVRKTVAA